MKLFLNNLAKDKHPTPLHISKTPIFGPIIIKKYYLIVFVAVLLFVCFLFPLFFGENIYTLKFDDENLEYAEIQNENIKTDPDENEDGNSKTTNDIKWIDFSVPTEIMLQALKYDIETHDKEIPLNWIELISYCASKNYGQIPKETKSRDMDDVVIRLQNGELMSEITKKMKLYSYYQERYNAVLGDLVGEFEVEQDDPENPGNKKYIKKYGLKGFCPIAKGYYYSHYDDFGVSRSYGYKRRHLGNDLMGSVGTPVIAVEDGYIEALGWNQYGGWRIGIRSLDKKRYYYYAHLKKDHPFNKSLKEGSFVQAGDVIGYLGKTGYSKDENVNNIKIPHLHFGLQIIFDESQKEGYNQIWVNVYEFINFLEKNKMPVYKDSDKEFKRSLNIRNVPKE